MTPRGDDWTRGPIYVATTNRHKADEIRAILAPAGLDLRTPDALPDVVEDGETFRDNALLKARAAARHLGHPALADDSGLAVEALGGEPGVRSARFSGPDADASSNNALLVERLVALGVRDPAAAFVCHVVVAAADGTVLAEAEGRVAGVIRWPPRGRGGFGYDPLFFHPPSGCRLAELPPDAKNAISHRGIALRRLAQAIRTLRAAASPPRRGGPPPETT